MIGGGLRAADRELDPQREVVRRKIGGATDPGFKRRLVVRDVAAAGATWNRAIGARVFEVDRAADLDLGHKHGGEPESSDLAGGVPSALPEHSTAAW